MHPLFLLPSIVSAVTFLLSRKSEKYTCLQLKQLDFLLKNLELKIFGDKDQILKLLLIL
jgi:hypothetical protein